MSIDLENELSATDFFALPELKEPPKPSDAHRAKITAVEAVTLTNEKKSTKIVVSLTSLDVPAIETRLDIWVPKGFVENFGPDFDPKSLPEVDFGKDDPRNNKQQTSYRIGISDSKKTATVQRIVAAALEFGRNPQELGLTTPKTFAQYVENLNALAQGIECVMTRAQSQKTGYMEVKRIFPMSTVENPPKEFGRLVKAWEN